MAASYDPALIQRLANGLYSRAALIEAFYTLAGMLLGAMGFPIFLPASLLAFGVFLAPDSSNVFGVLGMLLGGLLGYLVGSSKAFILRLTAQFALVQVEVAGNTEQTASLLRRDQVRRVGENPINAVPHR